jgi:hypothetical protein
MQIKPNFLRNPKEILNYVSLHLEKFKPREGNAAHTGIIPNVNSHFNTLRDSDMSNSLKQAIFRDNDFDELLRDTYSFIQIQQYLPGDYIVPHFDIYDITNLHLIILTDSDCDGLVYVDDGKINKLYDKAGTYVNVGKAFHWVDPVKETRYSLVVTE